MPMLLAIMAAIALVTAAVAQTRAQEPQPSAAGLWELVDAAGKPEGWFRIKERDGLYEGQIVRMFPKAGEDPADWRCTKCEGAQKNAPVLGITFISGMRRYGLAYENGTILDPRHGTLYSAMMQVSPDGRELTVRGYLGLPLFGQSQVWRRLPDSALDAAKLPPVAGKPRRPERVGTTGAADGR